MKQLSQTQLKVLRLLGDGLCHKGTELGQALGMTRSAIWKHINQLIELGIPIIRKAQQGYQLPNALILLNEEAIQKELTERGFSLPYKLHLSTAIDSTNRYLKDLELSPLLDVCCAEQQTQGKGRFGRHWHSPFGENIYCSIRWNAQCDLTRLSGLSLVTSLATLATVNEVYECPDIKIKWPNDLLWHDKKLCGSLIEINGESNGSAQIIIGIGLNVNSDTQNQPLADKPWCSLFEIMQKLSDRNELIARLVLNVSLYLNTFLAKGLPAFMAEWDRYDYLKGKHISVTQFSNSISGVACGIDSSGQLILEDDTGLKHYLSSGDTSIQAGSSS